MPTLYLSQLFPKSGIVVKKIGDQIQSYQEMDSVLIVDNRKDFNQKKIFDRIIGSEVLIMVIEDEVKSNSNFRISNRVRFEIVNAINLNLIIIPLLIEDAQLPDEEQISGTLKSLLNNKSYRLRTMSWFEVMEHLLHEI
jgi:hypothetical protein